MKLLLTLIVALAFSVQANAHEYFFGFAELSYSNEEGVYEGTFTLSTHDFEDWLETRAMDLTENDNPTKPTYLQQISREIFTGFQITVNGNSLAFEIVGMEHLDTGLTNYYFRSTKVEKSSTLDVTFDLMMDLFPQQQNKITYRDELKSSTAVFLSNKTKSSISL
ncbi:MAG: hypothetical protein P8P77_01630 [Crocinitomicaceae bacterium]|jgi:hypothetical protein|nr:hypothetical protein [Crocinitomicaceae bacterium]